MVWVPHCIFFLLTWLYQIQSFFFFNWNIIYLQCCVSFWCTAKWLSYVYICVYLSSLVAQTVKNLPAVQETQVPGSERSLEKEMATHSSIFAWRIPWTEEPGGLQFIGSQRVRQDWVTNTHVCVYRSMCIYMSTHMYVHLYVRVYIYICVSKHTFIYVCTDKFFFIIQSFLKTCISYQIISGSFLSLVPALHWNNYFLPSWPDKFISLIPFCD